jgi:chromosome segregation ATPase
MMTTAKRSYNRRSEDQRIADLESKIHRIKERLEMKQRKDSPVLREVTRVQRLLRKFAQTAQDHGRADLAMSTQAFAAGLDRLANTPGEPVRRRDRLAELAPAQFT